MDFANRGNRPLQQQPAPQVSTNDTTSSSSFSPRSDKGGKRGLDFSKLSSVFLLFGVAMLAAALIIALVFGGKTDTGNKETDLIQSDKYQAVFLNSQDGQVYFGKLAIYNSDLYALTDIYYVRVSNPVQPEGQNTQNQQANISLAKLGNELHGPQDIMYISRDKVLFWENLKDDGQVVKAITEYKATGGNSTQNNSNTTQQNTNSNSSNDTTDESTTQNP